MHSSADCVGSTLQSEMACFSPNMQLSAEEKAAIVCQKYIRAKLAKKEFAARLYQRFIQVRKERI